MMEPNKPMPISEVNRMGYETFIGVFGNVIEHCSLSAAAAWRNMPFRDVQHISDEISRFVDALPDLGKEGILRCHPDLAGRLAGLGQLTAESTREQKAAGLGDLTQEEKREIELLNNQYRTQFGFPFVICARKNKKAAILQGLRTRLNNSQEVELAQGIAEVKKICHLRLLDIVEDSEVESKL